ncbi:hypothetical protein [Marinoscillum sp.]|uniref:hypothetical protein n=1 Tax=Marinoscillum sp. TaxID=2024838 RepID=UPI003BAB20AC
MMTWLPHSQHTLVSEFSKNEVLNKVQARTQEVKSEYITEKPLFNGSVDEGGFRISSVIHTPQNALPLIVGSVESTSRGSIIFLKLKLFPAAILYLKAFSLLSFLISLVFLLLSKWYMGGLVALLIGLLNYLILTISFSRKCKEAIHTLENLLDHHQ